MKSAIKAIVLLALFGAFSFAQIQPPKDLPKEWRGKSAADLLAIPDVGRMPYVAQDQILQVLVPGHAGQSWTQRQIPIMAAENVRAESEKRKPRTSIIWDRGAGFATDYYSGGEHFYAILKHPLFLSVKVVEFEKYVRAWVYASNDKDSAIKFDLIPESVSYASLSPKPELREPVAAAQMAKSLRSGAKWRAALIAGLGGLATTTSTSQQSGAFDGTSSSGGSVSGTVSGTSTTTSPDYAAGQRALVNADAVQSAAEQKALGILTTALQRTTLFPGSAASGYVYFRRDRTHDASGVLRVVIGTIAIEFPVQW
jgi:hypothetical protein